MVVVDAINLVIPALGCIVVSFIFARVMLTDAPQLAHFAKHPNTSWALLLISMNWLSYLVIYSMLAAGLSRPWILAVSDLGSLCTVGGAIAYCSSSSFKVRRLVPLVLVGLCVGLWGIICRVFGSTPQTLLFSMSPSVVLATTAGISLGWAVMVRCGWKSWPFLTLQLLYAFAQLPAYFHAVVLSPTRDAASSAVSLVNVRDQYFAQLGYVFWFLALGKIVAMLMFLGYLFSPAHSANDAIDREAHWPKQDRIASLHPLSASCLKIVGLGLAAVFTGAVAAAFNEEFGNWIRSVVAINR